MSHQLATKCVGILSRNGSNITVAHCGHAPVKYLQDVRTLVTTILDELQQQGNKDHERQEKNARAIVLQSDILIDYAREMLHTYPYKDVPPCWRELYTDAGILKALGLVFLEHGLREKSQGLESHVGVLKEAIVACDNVLVMAGAAGPGRKELVFEMIEALENRIEEQENEPDSSRAKKQKTGSGIRLGEEPTVGRLPVIKHPIPRIHLPTMDAFQRHINSPSGSTPLIITGAFDHWPARERWTDLETICKTAGPDRLVPVEIGSQYTDEQWTQKLVTMREFIQEYIVGGESGSARTKSIGIEGDKEAASPTKAAVGYLAQHDLFDQIPRLRRDIDIPDYCMVEPREQSGYHPPEDVLLNAWFGPGGTVSPMHTDPYHNLLAQVVGRKYVRLYSPKETNKLYCFGNQQDQDQDQDQGQAPSQAESTMLSNTSQVNVEDPDLERHPLFGEAAYVETILEAGELLYIPFEWWHYIRSLSTSFSVSFWF